MKMARVRIAAATLVVGALGTAGLGGCCAVDECCINCGGPGEREQVEGAMEGYRSDSARVDADAIASWFAHDGVLFEPGIEPIVGPARIRAFVASFPGVKVDESTITADEIEIFGDTALYWGSYREKLRFPGQPASDQRGKLVAEWTRVGAGAWKIRRLFRVPLTTTVAETKTDVTPARSE